VTGYSLGIDLGTSFIRAATSRGGRSRMIPLGDQTVLAPSAVRVRPDGQIRLADERDPDPAVDREASVGRDFKRRLGDPTPMIVGGQPHSAVSLMAAGLKQVFESVCAAEEELPRRLTLTYPAVWGPYRREQFEEVPRRAGIPPELVALITEPEAAALHYANRRHLADDDTVAVYDLGGGTFDTAITRVRGGRAEILGAPEGVEWLGGVDFDDAVLGFVDRAVGGEVSRLELDDPTSAAALRRLKRECVSAKERLSRESRTDIPVLLPRGFARVPISRPEFENLVRTPLRATLEALERALRSTGVSGDDLAGVLLVGGSSRIPLVAEMVSAGLGRPVMVDRHPQHCVALGAAASADPRPPAAPTAPPGKRPGRRAVAGIVITGLVAAGAVAAVQAPWKDEPAAAPGAGTRPVATGSGAAAGAGPVRTAATVTGLGRRPQGVVLSPDGNLVYVPGVTSNSLAVLDARRGTVVRTVETPLAPQYVAVSRDGARLYVTLNDPAAAVNDVLVMDARSGARLARIPVGRTLFRPVLSPDGRSLYVPDHASSRIVVVDLATERVRRRLTVPSAPHSLALSADGRRLYAADDESGVVTETDIATSAIVRGIRTAPGPQALALSPDGSQLAVAGRDGPSVSLISTLDGRVRAEIRVGSRPLDLAWTPDGRRLLVVDDGSDSVNVLDPALARVTATIPVGREPWAVAVDPRGARAYVTNAGDDSVSVLDLGSGATG
jgi:YVTN family beta-propeller protein